MLEDPLPGGQVPGMRPLKIREVPSMYTVAFDQALLAYQVTADMASG